MTYTPSGLGPVVTLHWKEVEHAELAARHRNERALRQGVVNAYGLDANDAKNLSIHITGAAGELAVAKVLGRYWECGESKTDIAGGIEVRTMTVERYGLRIRPADVEAGKIVIAAIGKPPTFRVAGWINSADATRSEWIVDTHDGRPPFWGVPQQHLHPIERLRHLLAVEEALLVVALVA